MHAFATGLEFGSDVIKFVFLTTHHHVPIAGMQDQLICSGCKRVLEYRRGATGVCCPGCNTFTAANPSGSEMSELVCGGCFTMLVYNRGAANIRCPHCGRVNSTRSGKTSSANKQTIAVAFTCKFSATDTRFLLLIVKQRTRLATCHAGIAGLLWHTHREPQPSDAQHVAVLILSGYVNCKPSSFCSLLNRHAISDKKN